MKMKIQNDREMKLLLLYLVVIFFLNQKKVYLGLGILTSFCVTSPGSLMDLLKVIPTVRELRGREQ